MACVPQIDTMHPLSVEGAFLTITPTQKTIGCILDAHLFLGLH